MNVCKKKGVKRSVEKKVEKKKEDGRLICSQLQLEGQSRAVRMCQKGLYVFGLTNVLLIREQNICFPPNVILAELVHSLIAVALETTHGQDKST